MINGSAPRTTTYLEEERERNPLVVAVERPVLSVFIAESRLCHLRAHILAVHARQRVRVRYPTIRVYHVRRNGTVVDAVDWIAYN